MLQAECIGNLLFVREGLVSPRHESCHSPKIPLRLADEPRLVLFLHLRLVQRPAVLQWLAQGFHLCAKKGGHRRVQDRGMVRLQAFHEWCVLRWQPREAAVKWICAAPKEKRPADDRGRGEIGILNDLAAPAAGAVAVPGDVQPEDAGRAGAGRLPGRGRPFCVSEEDCAVKKEEACCAAFAAPRGWR